MCSIGGFQSSKPLPAELARRLAGALLFYGEWRGKEASGLWVNGSLLKAAVASSVLVSSPEFRELPWEGATLCLTHTRMPTCGGRDHPDAHPFQHGRTTVVHNGHVNNSKQLAEKYGLELKTEVDSEVLAAMLEKLGPQEFAAAYTKDVSGSAAIAAVHAGSLFLGRDGNPLEYFEVEHDGGQRTLVWGSTQTQVMDAIRHAWLMETRVSKSLAQSELVEVTPGGTQVLVGRFCTSSCYTVGRQWTDHRGYTPHAPLPYTQPAQPVGLGRMPHGHGWRLRAGMAGVWEWDPALAAKQKAQENGHKGKDRKDRNRNQVLADLEGNCGYFGG